MLMGSILAWLAQRKRHIDVFGSAKKGGASVANGAAGEQGVAVERYIAPDHSFSADRRRRNAVHGDLQTAGIAGAHRQSRPIRRPAALASLQYAREKHPLASVTDLDPAIGGRTDDDFARRVWRRIDRC